MTIQSGAQVAIQKGSAIAGQFSTDYVVSADGARIGYRQIGSGPGIVFLHGGMRASQHYLVLAEALADSHTVYIPDRRGRGLSDPPGDDYSIEKEMADLSAILQKTGARRVFGHSAGGFFALEAALRLPIRELAVYEPAVSIHGSLPLDWLPKFEQALARGNSITALVIFFKALQLSWISRLPAWFLSPFVRFMLRGEDGREMIALLPTGAWEIEEFQQLERMGLTYERYQSIPAKTLLISGTSSPAYLRNAARTLAKVIPQATLTELAGLDHNAPDQNAPQAVAAELRPFFS